MTLPTLQEFMAEEKYVLRNEWDDLILFNYTHECVYDQAWNNVTLHARGIIFNKVTGELIARPFAKFFNLGELEGVGAGTLPDLPFTATEKLDGSLGILYQHKGERYIASRGSLTSMYAKWGTQWAREHLNFRDIRQEYTYLFEIIHPENRIVVDYGERKELVLLSAVHKATGLEMPYAELLEESRRLNCSVTAAVQASSIDELVGVCKTLGKDKEGFVVTFSNGLKVKIKGDVYCQIHKMIMHMTPIAFWEAWAFDNDREPEGIPRSFLAQIPEEFRAETDKLAEAMHARHIRIRDEAEALYQDVIQFVDPSDKKAFAQYIQAYYKEQMNYLFFMRDIIAMPESRKWYKLWWSAHKQVRPTNNYMPEVHLERLKRVVDELL